MKNLLLVLLSASFSSVYAASFDGMLSGADSINQIAEQSGGKCMHYDDITIITKADDDVPGEQILVKKSPTADCEWQAESNWIVDSGEASYFKGKSKNWLIIERGTSVDNRDVLVYDLVTHEQTFSDTYSEPLKLNDDKLNYWKNSGKIATSVNCDKYDEAQKLGLSSQLQQYVGVDLTMTSLVDKPENKTRCQMMQ